MLSAILFAFLGGIILNLMPCVFPILSLKVISLASNAAMTRAQVRWQAIMYGVGVMVGLWGLFGIISALKASGDVLGWGFHLQSPVFVLGLIFLMSYIGLYLLEITPLPQSLYSVSSAAGNSHNQSSFYTGLLAVVVATPCTAPFMAVAIGAAFSLPIFYGFLIFTALAIGFAAPFLALAIVPSLSQKLPQPGPWLEILKEVMAFPMFLTAIWLIWVLYQQSGISGVMLSLIGILILSFAGWLTRHTKFKKVLWWLVILSMGASLVVLPKSAAPQAAHSSMGTVQTIQELRQRGKGVFVDVTASWCITCQINKKAVLHTHAVQTFFKDKDIDVVVLDWTSKNEEITRYLESFERSGVPLYVYYPPNKEGEVLPQLLSESIVKEFIQKREQ